MLIYDPIDQVQDEPHNTRQFQLKLLQQMRHMDYLTMLLNELFYF
jgi:hypothetical protein